MQWCRWPQWIPEISCLSAAVHFLIWKTSLKSVWIKSLPWDSMRIWKINTIRKRIFCTGLKWRISANTGWYRNFWDVFPLYLHWMPWQKICWYGFWRSRKTPLSNSIRSCWPWMRWNWNLKKGRCAPLLRRPDRRMWAHGRSGPLLKNSCWTLCMRFQKTTTLEW